FIGGLFSNIAYSEQEREVVVLVTPYLVDPMDCRQAPCKLPGLETRKPDDFELFLELILEAPRGQREVFPDKKYKAAWQNDPSANAFPCGGGAAYGTNGVGGACGNGACGALPAGLAPANGATAPAAVPTGAPPMAAPANLPPVAPASIEQ